MVMQAVAASRGQACVRHRSQRVAATLVRDQALKPATEEDNHWRQTMATSSRALPKYASAAEFDKTSRRCAPSPAMRM